MEDFILGLLMINKSTAYELHTLIKNNFEGIYSHSIGNIQRALKKLHEKEQVTLEEVHEGKVVKKVFGITPAGRTRFMTWLNKPIDLMKVKNMALGNLLLLGFLSQEEQLANIDKTISDYKEAIAYLELVEETVITQHEMATEQGGVEKIYLEHQKNNEPYIAQLMDAVESDDYFALMHSVARFQKITLRFGMDQIKFELDWFEKLRKELTEEEDNE